MPRQQSEYNDHVAVCHYLRSRYPQVIFTSDLSGIWKPLGLARKVSPLKSTRGIPDILIFYPNATSHGLFIEMKHVGWKMKKDTHTKEQMAVLQELEARGYTARFCAGYEEAVTCIDTYMHT